MHFRTFRWNVTDFAGNEILYGKPKFENPSIIIKNKRYYLMDEQLRIILIIIVSVSIFGLLVFVFVKNYLRSRINQMVKEDIKNKSK